MGHTPTIEDDEAFAPATRLAALTGDPRDAAVADPSRPRMAWAKSGHAAVGMPDDEAGLPI